MVIMWTISTSRSSGARRISASISVSGSAQPGWIYTRMPDRTHCSASSAVFSRTLYCVSHIYEPLAGAKCALLQAGPSLRFISYRSIINGPVEEHFEHLEQFELPKNFRSPIHHGFPFQEVPEIFLRKYDRLDQFAERHLLLGPVRADRRIAAFDIFFILAQQPLAEVTINLKDAFLQFMLGQRAVVGNLLAGPGFGFHPGSQQLCVGLNQMHEPVGEHHKCLPSPLLLRFFASLSAHRDLNRTTIPLRPP